jgi:hypothetical protein
VAITESLDNLLQLVSKADLLFPHSDPFVIHVNSLSYSRHFYPKSSRKPRANPDIFTLISGKKGPTSLSGAESNSRLTRPRLRESELDLQYELRHSGKEYHEVTPMLGSIQENGPSDLDDLNLHLNSIAEEERYREQALRRFYGKAPTTVSNHQCPYTKPSSNYSRLGRGNSIRDELLMLYRDPPPWTNIPGPSSTNVESTKQASCNPRRLASVDRESTKAHQGRDGIFSMIAERKRATNVKNPRSISRTTETTRSKNPFLRQVRSSGLATNTELDMSLHRNVASENVQTPAQTPVKSLKPISSLPVPALPDQSTLKKTKTSTRALASGNSPEPGYKKQAGRQTTLPGIFFGRR